MALTQVQGGMILPSTTLTTPIVATTMGVGGATPAASGSGITFPATQSASTDANTLDDYEEGTWTPVNASIASITLSVTQARYIKIGRLVFVTCYLDYPSTSDTNQAKIGGFPFTQLSNNTYSYMSGRTLYSGSKAPVYWQVQTNSTEAAAFQSGAGNAVNNNDLSGSYVIFSGCYFAAA